MPQQPVDDNKVSDVQEAPEGRRPVLRKIGRFAAVTAPAVALLLAAKTKPAAAVTSVPPL